MPVSANLAAWLDRYNKPAGLLLPERWQDADLLKQMRKLDDMGKHISRKAIPSGNPPAGGNRELVSAIL